MEDILGSLENFAGIKGKLDDDFYDRLNNRFSVFIILGFCAVTSFYQLSDSPIYCWAPVHFTG